VSAEGLPMSQPTPLDRKRRHGRAPSNPPPAKTTGDPPAYTPPSSPAGNRRRARTPAFGLPRFLNPPTVGGCKRVPSGGGVGVSRPREPCRLPCGPGARARGHHHGRRGRGRLRPAQAPGPRPCAPDPPQNALFPPIPSDSIGAPCFTRNAALERYPLPSGHLPYVSAKASGFSG